MQISCPHCGATAEIGEAGAEQSCVCDQCGKPVAVPVARSKLSRLQADPLRLWLVIVMVFVGCDAIGIGMSLFLPAVQAAREAARRSQCTSNLQEIGLAMYRYHEKHGSFPPAFLTDADGKPMHSWRVLILPFLGEEQLYSEYRFDEPWNSEHNRALAARMPAVYYCPSDQNGMSLQTSYVMLVEPGTISDGSKSHSVADIRDGLANTILLAEAVDANIAWMEPRDLNAEAVSVAVYGSGEELPRDARSISSRHVQVPLLFCDGSVRTYDRSLLSEDQLKAMTTIAGGERIPSIPKGKADLVTESPSKWPDMLPQSQTQK